MEGLAADRAAGLGSLPWRAGDLRVGAPAAVLQRTDPAVRDPGVARARGGVGAPAGRSGAPHTHPGRVPEGVPGPPDVRARRRWRPAKRDRPVPGEPGRTHQGRAADVERERRKTPNRYPRRTGRPAGLATQGSVTPRRRRLTAWYAPPIYLLLAVLGHAPAFRSLTTMTRCVCRDT